jgi:hypothetical protein
MLQGLAKVRVRVVPPETEKSAYVSHEPYAIDEMPVVLEIADSAGRILTLDLTAMSEEELDCLAEMFLHGIEGARPVVRQLDKLAVEAFAGDYDDIPIRALRGRPAMFKREVITDVEWGTRGPGPEPVPIEESLTN